MRRQAKPRHIMGSPTPPPAPKLQQNYIFQTSLELPARRCFGPDCDEGWAGFGPKILGGIKIGDNGDGLRARPAGGAYGRGHRAKEP